MTEIEKELARAKELFPSWPEDPFHALAILGEEFGELTKAVVEHTYESATKGVLREDVRKEAVHTAAMAVRFLEGMANYWFQPDRAHKV